MQEVVRNCTDLKKNCKCYYKNAIIPTFLFRNFGGADIFTVTFTCYESCLKLAEKNGLKSVAFYCISTGVFMFPNQRAAEIAVETVKT